MRLLDAMAGLRSLVKTQLVEVRIGIHFGGTNLELLHNFSSEILDLIIILRFSWIIESRVLRFDIIFSQLLASIRC